MESNPTGYHSGDCRCSGVWRTRSPPHGPEDRLREWRSASARRVCHTPEHFSENDHGKLNEGKYPAPEHKSESDLYDSCRSWTYPGVSSHFALLPDGECGLSRQIRCQAREGGEAACSQICFPSRHKRGGKRGGPSKYAARDLNPEPTN